MPEQLSSNAAGQSDLNKDTNQPGVWEAMGTAVRNFLLSGGGIEASHRGAES